MTKLRRQRQMLGLSQYELARAAGISPGKIAYWETRRVQLSEEEIERVKRALALRAEEVKAAIAAA
jgi:transcriptional regulator with XRE-family HTH domain